MSVCCTAAAVVGMGLQIDLRLFSEVLICCIKIRMGWGWEGGNGACLWKEDRNWVPWGELL